MNKTILKYSGWLLAGTLFLSFFATLSLAPLFDLDEGAFSEATREMLHSGNYLTTYLNGVLRFDKPILVYWLQAVSVVIFSKSEIAFRLPSAIAATIWCSSIYWFGRKYFDKTIAFLAAFFMATSLQTTIIGKAAIADSLLNMCITFSMFYMYIYIERREKKYLYLTFTAIAFGFLAKGPVALLIPLAVTFIYLIIKKDIGFFFKSVFNPLGIFLFSIIALPWYFLEYQDQGMLFINGFFLKHNLARFNTSFEGHSGSLLYYIPVLFLGLLPYTSLLLKSIGRIRNWFKSDLLLFLSIWFLFVFLFFSFSGTKLPHYVIYGYTPLFFIMALYLKEIKNHFLFFLPVILFFSVLLLLPEIALSIKDIITDEFAQVLIVSAQEYFTLSYRLFFIFALVILLCLSFTKRCDILIKTIILGGVSIVAVNFIVLPTYGAIAQVPIKEAALLAKDRGYDVVFYGIDAPSFIVITEKLVEERTPRINDIVLTKINHLHDIGEYEILYQKNGIMLVKVKK